MDSIEATYDEEYTLTTNAYTREGYTFTGWNTEADGSGTSYEDGATVSNLTTTDGDTVTLYAQWEEEDESQKNQQTTEEESGFLTKTAEWTDKENGEALITLTGSIELEEEVETTALYVTTLCYGHGLSTDIIVQNVLYLLEYYDNVDLIVVAPCNDDLDINMNNVTYNSETTETEVESYITELRTYNEYTYPHYSSMVSAAVYKYLFGDFVGDDYISENNMINDPIAIYVSTDALLTNRGGRTCTERTKRTRQETIHTTYI